MSTKTKSIISGIVLVALIAGVLALAASWLGKDTKSISSTEFAVGAINAEGVYVKNDQSIYTKDLIECQGLSIEPDFEATGTYQVFYYGEDKNFIGSTDPINAEDGVYNKGNTFVFAKYCRIMITPDVPTDEDGNVEEDFKIRFYEVAGYANDYNITVNKKQNYSVSGLLKNGTDVCVLLGQGTWLHEEDVFQAGTTPFYFFDKVDVSEATHLVLKVKTSTLSAVATYADAEFTFPMMYDGSNGDLLTTLQYSVIHVDDDFSYISYNVTEYTSILGCVDVGSIDILEIYVFD